MDVVRVLLVDDQPTFMHALASVVVETPGFVVVGRASSGEECLQLVEEVDAGLVLLDVNLPGMDGVEVARRLRIRGDRPVVVLLSTYDQDAGDRFVLESGAKAYLTKSAFEPDLLTRMWVQWSG